MSAFKLPSWPYPSSPPKPGIWGEVTSLENYCEEDYLITHLFAEFVNTTTNIAYLIYAWYGVSKSRQFPDFWIRSLPYFGIAGVGICSSLFHGTVKLRAQWADDLSMFFAIGIILHRVFAFGHSPSYSRWLGVGVVSALTGIAVYHCTTDTSTIHQAAFVGMALSVAYQTAKLIRGRVQNRNVRRKMVRMANLGTGGLLFAWFLWGLDNLFCDSFRLFRRSIGLPWGHLFELHGWWHIITAIAVYNYFVLVEPLTSEGSVEENIRAAGSHAWPVSSSLLTELNKPVEKKEQ